MFYIFYFIYEIKRWMRDPLTAFLLTYPLVLAAIGRFLIAGGRLGTDLTPYYPIILIALSMITAKITGVLAAFSILDDRDDKIFYAVRVAPLSFDFYMGLKLFITYLFSFAGTAFVMWFSNLATLPAGVIVSISLLAALGAPLSALLINCMASNKIEGFAAVKALNALIIFPIVSLFFTDAKEFIFSFEPSFWPAKALNQTIIKKDIFQLSYNGYYFIGLAYVVILSIITYQIFKRKMQ